MFLINSPTLLIRALKYETEKNIISHIGAQLPNVTYIKSIL